MALSDDWLPKKARTSIGALLACAILFGGGVKATNWFEAQAETIADRRVELLREQILKKLVRIEVLLDELRSRECR